MAVGDVISEISTVAAGTAYFQPSAGTEIIVTWVSSQGIAYAGLYNGVNTSIGYTAYNTTAGMNGKTSMKIGITNTNYLMVYTNGTYSGYSGIQTK